MENVNFGFIILGYYNVHVIVNLHTSLMRWEFSFLFIWITFTFKEIWSWVFLLMNSLSFPWEEKLVLLLRVIFKNLLMVWILWSIWLFLAGILNFIDDWFLILRTIKYFVIAVAFDKYLYSAVIPAANVVLFYLSFISYLLGFVFYFLFLFLYFLLLLFNFFAFF